MKLSRKGFMLAEVVVVSVVVATVLVTLFAGLNNISSAYRTRNIYYDIELLFHLKILLFGKRHHNYKHL